MDLGSKTTGNRLFFREVPVDDGSLAVSRFFTTVFAWRCPACARSKVTSGWLAVKESCPRCGSRFKRLEGNELVSMSLSFFFASVVTFLVGLSLILRFSFFPGVTWVLVAVGLLTVVVGLRPMRVLALWLLWLIGFVYPDGVPKGKSVARVD